MCTCSTPSATFHRHPHRNAHASRSLLPLTGTPTYAQKSWGGHPRCDLAPLTTSFGTVALRERQHLAMAGSRHLHFPRNATAHCAARANYHVPHCSVLAEVDVRSCRLLTTGTVTRCIRCMRRGYEGCVSWVLLRSLVARCLAPIACYGRLCPSSGSLPFSLIAGFGQFSKFLGSAFPSAFAGESGTFR